MDKDKLRGKLRQNARLLSQMATLIQAMSEQMVEIEESLDVPDLADIAEKQSKEGEEVPDHNDVWGGAGPDCVPDPTPRWGSVSTPFIWQ